ncbi:MAG: hypothetical protein AB7L36_16140 [Sphingomonadaceae bacterium]
MSGHGEFESPVELPAGGPRKRALGWTTLTIFVASLFLLVTNAFSIKSWIDEQPASPLQARLASWAGEWQSATDALGLGTPRAELHALWKKAQSAKFDDVEADNQR